VTALMTRNAEAGGANLSAFPEANGHA
jgi:hypothetical protein